MIASGAIRRAKREFFSTGGLLVLYFHNPRGRYFAKVIKWLKKNGFSVVNAEDVVEYYTKGKTLPKCPVWITLDDGWRGNYQNVYPVLKKENIRVSIFAVTESIETTGVFWWTYLESYRNFLPDKFRKDVELLWKVPESERKQVCDELYNKIKENLAREALTVDELKEMSGSGLVAFGSHTVNHVITPNCTDDELNAELTQSKQKIEEWTGKKINVFAYPNADYTDREEKFLASAGYDIAVISGNRFANKNDNRFRIPRMGMGEAYFPEELCHMFGVWQRFIKKFKE